jgi:hypothetical protein
MDLGNTEHLFHSLGQFAQKNMGFKKPPVLNLVSDKNNADKSLGKTAFYDPQSVAVTIYTDNRHTKDILRSLAHELVHHTQNENGMLNDSGYHGAGYAQKNKSLRQSEKEAYLKGNMCFRDWEDGLKQEKPTIYNEWRINTMSTKEWKNKELMENLSEKFGFKMNLKVLKENKEENEINEKKKKPDFLDLDGDGDKEEPISKAQKDKEAKESGKDDDSKEDSKDDTKEDAKDDDSKEDKSDKDLSKVPPQLRKHVAKSMKESKIMTIIKKEIMNQIKELKKSK